MSDGTTRWVETEAYGRIATNRPPSLASPLSPSIEVGHSRLHEHFPRQMLFQICNQSLGESVPPIAHSYLLDAAPNQFPDGPIMVRALDREMGKFVDKPHGFWLGQRLGNKLTDNSYESDGYRFHDALHIALLTYTGWSPVLRSLLGLKRRSLEYVDEIDDGGRAVSLEESIFAWVGGNRLLSNEELSTAINAVAGVLERSVRPLTANRLHIPRERWRNALKVGALLLERLHLDIGVIDDRDRVATKSAYIAVDLDRQEVRYTLKSPEVAWAGELIRPTA